MDNKEIIEGIAVLNETLKTINPEALPLTDGNASSETYKIVLMKIEHLTMLLYSPLSKNVSCSDESNKIPHIPSSDLAKRTTW